MNLPDHVRVQRKANVAGRVVHYFYYVLPDGTREALGKDLEEAKAAAEALNRELYARGAEQRIEQILSAAEAKSGPALIAPLSAVCDEFDAEWLAHQEYSDGSLRERRWKLDQYRRQWGDTPIRELRTFDLAEFLRPRSPETKRQHRYLLIQLFNFAKSQGYYDDENPANSLLRVKAQKRRRRRHTWQGFQMIRQSAEPWLRRAIDIAFYSLQRRSDLVALNFAEHIDLDAGTMTVRQQKTDEYENPVFIEIAMGRELAAVVRECRQSDVPCPYVVHCRPKKITAAMRAARPHPFAVLPEYLTRAFSRVRDECGAYNAIENPAERPTLHDVRALGIWTYFQAGYPAAYIQALAGHATERMTQHYRDGHEKPKPVRVEAGLSLTNVDFSEIEWETQLPKSLQELLEDGE